MYDHLIYNTRKLRVTELLEIPEESCFAPSRASKSEETKSNHCTFIPNVVYPSAHLRLEAVF